MAVEFRAIAVISLEEGLGEVRFECLWAVAEGSRVEANVGALLFELLVLEVQQVALDVAEKTACFGVLGLRFIEP